MGYIFISYSSKNQNFANAIKNLLSNEGIRTWMAPGDIPTGSSYLREINQAVKNCSCFLLLLSEASQGSQWVTKELERAVNYRKVIFPVQIEDVILNDEFEFALSACQVVAINKIDRDNSEIQKLLKSIVSLAGVEEKTPAPVFETHSFDYKPGPNDPCPCGSGKKYKRCCGVPGKQSYN